MNQAEDIVRVVVQSLTMLLPIATSGIVLIASMKLRWLESLNRPLDFGATFRGRRLFGDGKTIRGLAVHVVVASAVVALLHSASPAWWLAPQFSADPIELGLSISLFYVAGELGNSFVKRRLGIATGGDSRTLTRLQRVIDNIDGSVAVGIPLIIWYQVPWQLLITTGVLGYLLHEATDAWMRRLRLKREK